VNVLESDDAKVTVELTRDELRIVTNALNEICNGPDAIEEWEFHTRIGAESSEAVRLLAEVGDQLG
jgi:hypothetical protein